MSAIAHPGRAHGGDLQAAASAAAGRSTSAGPAPTSLALLLAQAAPVGSQRTAQRRLRRAVLVPLAVAALLMAGWSAWAPLSGAVVASGQVQAALGRKPVQHQEGGLLREVLVQPGQAVRRGDPLMVIGDLRSDATLALLRGQAEAEALRAARSQAELALAAGFEPPAGLAPAPAVLAREQALFDARRRSLQEQLAAMQSQSREAQSRIAALQSQLLASERAVSLSGDELAMNAELVAAGFIQKSRLLAVERGVAETRVRAESVRGQIAEAQMQVSSLANAMAQARGAYQQRAAEDLKEAGARLREIEERLRPSQDQVDRQTVRAPVDGTVMALRVSAPGSTVAPRETLLEIAPSDERLVIELRIDPHDIEHVRPGDAAEVLLSAFEARSTPLLQAVVTSVSPDAMTEPNGRETWFSAQVTVQADDLAAHPHLRLQAGMPAEVFVTTPPRSLLRYLLEPVGVFARRALREP